MPRYYFDVRDNGAASIDETGHEFASVNEARLEAAKAARRDRQRYSAGTFGPLNIDRGSG